jgi:hypothetical protein
MIPVSFCQRRLADQRNKQFLDLAVSLPRRCICRRSCSNWLV